MEEDFEMSKNQDAINNIKEYLELSGVNVNYTKSSLNALQELVDAEEIITFDKYQKQALRTANVENYDKEIMLNAVLGLNGETGEIADSIKKSRFQGHELNREHLIEELGDVLWYVSLMAYSLNINLSTVAKMNIDKLMKRYPEGFSAERSQNRKGELK